MAEKKGTPPEKVSPGAASRRNNPTSTTLPPGFVNLERLRARLIPLCRPTENGCTCPSHNKEQPCAPQSRGKAPIERGWSKPGHQSQWPDYPFNVGIRCGGHLNVLDIDPRNGGTERLAALESAYGRLPPSPEVLTGGGGRHLYFKGAADQVSWKLPGVELKANGSQVVAPGSLHESGRKYDWAGGHTLSDMELPELPYWLTSPPTHKEPALKAVQNPPEPDPRAKAWKGDILTWESNEYTKDSLIERAKLYLEAMPPSVAGHGGHDVAFRVAVALVRGFVLPDRDSRLILGLWNANKAKPKWSKGELEHKLTQAATKVREAHWTWGYLLTDKEPKWPELSVEEQPADEEDGDAEPKQRTIEPRLVYIAAHDKFMWFLDGVETAGLPDNWQSQFSEGGARAILQSAGYSFKKASLYVKEKRCHIVKDFSERTPSNQRLIKGGNGETYLHLPEHLIPDAVPGDTPLLDHLMHVIAGGDPEAIAWLWNWAAYIVQKPSTLPGVCVVVRGPQGVGKSKLGQMIGQCRGGYTTANNSIFKAQFTSSWADALFISAAEVMLADSRKEHTDRFKAWITDERIEYHRKNQPEFMIPNRIAWWLTSNDDNPVVVPAGDRRFTILESIAPDPELKVRLIHAWKIYERHEHEWAELQAFRHKLMNYPVNEEKARNPLYNAIHDQHQDASKTSVELFVDAVKNDGWRPLAARYPVQGVTLDEEFRPGEIGVEGALLYKTYALWAKDHGMGVHGFGRFVQCSPIRTAFKLTPQHRVRGIRCRFWILPIGVDPDNDAD